MSKKRATDPVHEIRETLRQAAEASGLTQQEIGERMGFDKADARKAVSRLLNLSIKYDPRLSTLVKFSEAIGRPLRDLL